MKNPVFSRNLRKEEAVAASSDWWKSLTPTQQRNYKELHPKSKLKVQEYKGLHDRNDPSKHISQLIKFHKHKPSSYDNNKLGLVSAKHEFKPNTVDLKDIHVNLSKMGYEAKSPSKLPGGLMVTPYIHPNMDTINVTHSDGMVRYLHHFYVNFPTIGK